MDADDLRYSLLLTLDLLALGNSSKYIFYETHKQTCVCVLKFDIKIHLFYIRFLLGSGAVLPNHHALTC